MRKLRGIWLGRRRYEPVHRLQRELQSDKLAGAQTDVVLFVEHEPVITLGRGAKRVNLLTSEENLARRGIEIAEVGRGGDITLHAPGQLVCYPILNLAPDRRDVRRYVRDLTETMRRLVAECGVDASPIERYIGLWVDRASPARWPGIDGARDLAKLGAVGVRISRWITMHGFALNLAPDLSLYDVIVPCGISELGVTSVAQLTGSAISVGDAAARALGHLASVFDSVASELEDASDTALENSHLRVH